jgi:S-adenosylmethionine decarboxylase
MLALGRQVLVELYSCDPEILRDEATVRARLLEAVRLAKATIVTDTFHGFSPHGVSGVVVIAESHVAIHTWPEHRYAAVDIFTCGETIDPWVIQRSLEESFRSERVSCLDLRRGPARS